MKILIVEDERKLASALKRGLTHHGYAVDTLADGEEALTRIKLYRDEYDLVVLDLMLPSMNGHEVCRLVREEGVTLPIIILTARNETDTKVDLLLSGADDYLSKPFSFEELFARIHALLRRPVKSIPQVIRIKDIELNPVERTVRRGDETIPLTLKEFRLLEYFMRNPNEVIVREDLLNKLWDFNYTGFGSNVIDVHVKNLRKKLGDPRDGGVLETVRGVGYRLSA